MADSGYIHGGSDLREVERLERQAFFVAPITLRFFDASAGHRVLDLATGVGAMAEQLHRRYPGIELYGLDVNEAQLGWAKARHPIAHYLRGDATQMPFETDFFDRVHCSWLLEHVRNPLDVLRDVRRVLKPGGYCHFIEVDNATLASTPPIPEMTQTFRALDEAQQRGGGDPYVGRRLGELLKEAGFSKVRAFPNPLRGNASDPIFFRAFVEEFAEIAESLDEALPAQMAPVYTAAAAKLRALPLQPGGELRYTSYIGQGVK